MVISSFSALKSRLQHLSPREAVVAAAHDEHTLQAVFAARRDGLIRPILVGRRNEIRSIARSLGEELSPCLLYTSLQGSLVHLSGTFIGDVLFEFLPAAAEILAQMAHIHALPSVLVGGHAGDDLGGDGTGHLEALGALDELAVHHLSLIHI